MKTALVLSGGGAKGAFQAGAVYELYQAGIRFDVVAGVSVGALNGSMVAQDRIEEMVTVWKTVRQQDVFTKYSLLRILFRLLFGAKSLYSLLPLKKLLHKHLQKDRLQIPFFVGSTSLFDKEYHSLPKGGFASDEHFVSAVYASAAMPVYWEGEEVDSTHRLMFDGGLRTIVPLSDVIDQNPDKIYIINCSDGNIEIGEQSSFLKRFESVIDILTSQIFRDDMDKFLEINRHVLEQGVGKLKKKDGTPYRYFEPVIIQPPYHLGSSIDFSRDKLDEYFQLGRNAVCRHVSPFK